MSEAQPATEVSVEAEFEALDVDAPRVGIIMGSKSDLETMEKAGKVLEEHGVRHEIRVCPPTATRRWWPTTARTRACAGCG